MMATFGIAIGLSWRATVSRESLARRQDGRFGLCLFCCIGGLRDASAA
jgi:hypothetical protein